MRDRSWRAALAASMLVVPATASVLAACGGGSSSNGSEVADGSGDALDATGMSDTALGDTTTAEGAAGDSSTPDASRPEGATDVTQDAAQDATQDATQDSSAGPDAGQDADAQTPPFFDAGDCGVGPSGEPTDLSCTGLYSDWPSKTVSSDVELYDPGLHFWSDGAQKTRWISLPAGTTIDTSNMDEWTFPVGTRIWKEFRLPLGDAATDTRIETRLLWKLNATTWYRTTYRWTDDGETDATELTTGQADAGGTGYEIPNKYQCSECHNGRIDGVLGFEAVSLSSPAASGVTIQTLTAQGLLTAPPATPLVVPGEAVESAALGWLHSNCGTACHNNGNGAAGFSGFWMRLDVATLTSVQTTNTWVTGWNKQTGGFDIQDAAVSYRLHACDIASSCAYYRASRRDGVNGVPLGTQMPPIDSHKVDDVDVAALAAWINEGCDGGP
jgi:hypothetical protein